MEKSENELLTAKKVAEKIEISEAKVKKMITELNIDPDAVKGVCKYYGTESIEKLKKAFNK